MTAPDMFLCDEDNAVLEAIRKRLADPLSEDALRAALPHLQPDRAEHGRRVTGGEVTMPYYSDDALAKQAALAALPDGAVAPLSMLLGICEPRVKPTDTERCNCCGRAPRPRRADARRPATYSPGLRDQAVRPRGSLGLHRRRRGALLPRRARASNRDAGRGTIHPVAACVDRDPQPRGRPATRRRAPR